jgi:ankyrin repeat protein
MHTKNFKHTFVSQILISLFVLTLGSSCGVGNNPNQTTIHSNQQTKLQTLLTACNSKNEEKLLGLILPKGAMNGFTCDDILNLFSTAEKNNLGKMIPYMQVACRRDCSEAYKQFLQMVDQVKKSEEIKKKANQQETKSKIQFPTDSYGRTPFYTACEQGHVDIVKQFVDHGADVNQPEGLMPLHIACEKGYLDIVQLLVEHGAEIHQEDMDIARQKGHQAIVNLLTEYQKKQVAIN